MDAGSTVQIYTTFQQQHIRVFQYVSTSEKVYQSKYGQTFNF